MSKKSSKKTGKAKFEDFDISKALQELPSTMAPAPIAAAPSDAQSVAAPVAAAEPVEYVPLPLEAMERAAPPIQVTVGVVVGVGGPSVGIGMPQLDSTALVKEPGPPAKRHRVTVDGAPVPPIPEDLIALL
jgi:hypothetical protein